MRLQRVSAKDRGNLIKREPVEGLPAFHWGKNIFCQLRHNQIFDKKRFSKLERGRDRVVECDLLKEIPREVLMQVIERAAHPHFHATTQIDKRRGERYGSCDANAPAVVKGLPLTDCCRR